MAKKSAIQKNLNKAIQVKKNKSRRDRLKAICSDRSIPIEERFEAQLKLSKLPKNSAKIRIRKRSVKVYLSTCEHPIYWVDTLH